MKRNKKNTSLFLVLFHPENQKKRITKEIQDTSGGPPTPQQRETQVETGKLSPVEPLPFPHTPSSLRSTKETGSLYLILDTTYRLSCADARRCTFDGTNNRTTKLKRNRHTMNGQSTRRGGRRDSAVFKSAESSPTMRPVSQHKVSMGVPTSVMSHIRVTSGTKPHTVRLSWQTAY